MTYHNSPPAMDWDEKARIRQAESLAHKHYPGPVGELIAQWLMDWENFGYRLGKPGLVNRLLEHLSALENERQNNESVTATVTE